MDKTFEALTQVATAGRTHPDEIYGLNKLDYSLKGTNQKLLALLTHGKKLNNCKDIIASIPGKTTRKFLKYKRPHFMMMKEST